MVPWITIFMMTVWNAICNSIPTCPKWSFDQFASHVGHAFIPARSDHDRSPNGSMEFGSRHRKSRDKSVFCIRCSIFTARAAGPHQQWQQPSTRKQQYLKYVAHHCFRVAIHQSLTAQFLQLNGRWKYCISSISTQGTERSSNVRKVHAQR
jgi:hypothetical protein